MRTPLHSAWLRLGAILAIAPGLALGAPLGDASASASPARGGAEGGAGFAAPGFDKVLPGLTITPHQFERLDRPSIGSSLRDDAGSRLHTGERLEDPTPANRLGATIRLPF